MLILTLIQAEFPPIMVSIILSVLEMSQSKLIFQRNEQQVTKDNTSVFEHLQALAGGIPRTCLLKPQ